MVALIPQVALSILDPATGTTQPIDVGDLKLAGAIAVCPGGPIALPVIPKGVDHAVLYRINPDGSGASSLASEGIVRFPVCLSDGKIGQLRDSMSRAGTQAGTFRRQVALPESSSRRKAQIRILLLDAMATTP